MFLIYKIELKPTRERVIILVALVLTLIFAAPKLSAQQLAFPEAEGAGKYTTGGRGGVVYEVTNLDDSGVGSLRDAIGKTGARTIVFRVSGNIKLKSTLKISKGDVTIAGQTAPGDGICLSNYTLSVQANNVIIRFIRCRLGDTTLIRDANGTPYWNATINNYLHVEDDAAHGMGTYKNIILDHCSFSWSIDECASFYGNESFTMQWCLISESLYNSFHTKGKHGYGGIWGGKNASFHHNLLAHHTSRNPRFAGGETAVCVNVDFRNNVIYNWGFNSVYGGEAGTINMVANYYKSGPATDASKRYRIVEPSSNPALGKGPGKFFVDQNYVAGSTTISANNWSGGVQGSFVNDTSIKAIDPFPFEPIAIQTAEEAYVSVLQNVGACIPKRDTIDSRIISETETGTITFGGSYGVGKGIIDSQEDVGGWPILNSTTPPVDTDKDGMPDDWELAKNLNPNNSDDRNLISSSGYTNLEDYLNELGTIVTSVEEKPISVANDYKLFQNYPNPFNPSTKIVYNLEKSDFIKLEIFNTLGQRVQLLVDAFQTAGVHEIYWNAANSVSGSLFSGIYFAKLNSGERIQTLKLILLK